MSFVALILATVVEFFQLVETACKAIPFPALVHARGTFNLAIAKIAGFRDFGTFHYISAAI